MSTIKKFRRYIRALKAGKEARGIKVNDVKSFQEQGWIDCRLERFPLGCQTIWFVTEEGQRQLAPRHNPSGVKP